MTRFFRSRLVATLNPSVLIPAAKSMVSGDSDILSNRAILSHKSAIVTINNIRHKKFKFITIMIGFKRT